MDRDRTDTTPPAWLGAWSEDRCATCGAHLGSGYEAFHLGCCEDCRPPADDDDDEDQPIHVEDS